MGWSKSGIEQVCQPVSEYGSLLARVDGWQFRKKLPRRFFVDNQLAQQNPLCTHTPLIVAFRARSQSRLSNAPVP